MAIRGLVHRLQGGAHAARAARAQAHVDGADRRRSSVGEVMTRDVVCVRAELGIDSVREPPSRAASGVRRSSTTKAYELISSIVILIPLSRDNPN